MKMPISTAWLLRAFILLSFLMVFAPSAVYAAPKPVIFYTDLTSGPSGGGKDGKGAFVRIFGKNFGSSRGTSTVTLGGFQVADYMTWSDTEVAVQLGSQVRTGNMVVTTASGSSNGMPFTVRPGSIYFVDVKLAGPGSGTFASPWSSLSSCVTNMVAGDICYIRSGTYSGKYDGTWAANFDFTAGHGGSPGMPIAYVGYPGEMPFFTGQTNTIMWHGTWKTVGSLVFANLEATPVNGVFVLNINAGQLYIENNGAEDLRFVNNKIHNIASVGATGIFKLAGNNNVCLGNEIYDNAAPVSKNLAHSFYPSNGLDNLVIAYNYMHDNDWDATGGYEISLHTDGIAVTGSGSVDTVNARIYNNRIESGSGNVRGIGVGRVGENSTIYIYNNIISVNKWSTIFAAGGRVYIYNNTLHSAGPDANNIISFNGPSAYPGIQGGEIANNILYANPDATYFPTTNNFILNFDLVSNNLYWGNGAGPSIDANAINANPNLVNPAGGDFRLQSTSTSAIDAGTATLISGGLVSADFNGTPRFSFALDIGAYEFVTDKTPLAPAGVLIRK